MATIPDWSRLIGQQIDDENWRTRADLWHDEVQAQTNTNTTDIATNLSTLTTLSARFTATTSWIPTWTQSNTVTKTVDFADYHITDGWVDFELHMTATGAGTANNAHVIGLPLDPLRTTNRPIASGWWIPTASGVVFPIMAYRSGTAQMTIFRTAAEITNPFIGVTGTTAAAASGDSVALWGHYRRT